MVKNYIIKPDLKTLITLSFYLILISGIAQEVLEKGQNTLIQKEITYRKQLGIKITPTLNYFVNKDYEETIEIRFFAEWFNLKNGTKESPDKECIYIINNPDKFPEFARNIANKYGYNVKGINDPETGDIKRTIELSPNNFIRYTPEEYPDQFQDSSKIINAFIINDKYYGEVIKLEVRFYLGTKTPNKNNVEEKSPKDLTWEFQLLQQRPKCIAKYTQYIERLNEVRPKSYIKDIENNLPTNKNELIKNEDIESVKEKIREWSLAIDEISLLKDSVQNEILYNQCQNLKDLVINFDAYLNNKGKIESFKDLLGIQEQLGDSVMKIRQISKSFKDKIADHINAIQKIYREIKFPQYFQKDTNLTVIESIADKFSQLEKLKNQEDSILTWISEKKYSDAKTELNHSEFVSYYNAINKIKESLGSNGKSIRSANQQDTQTGINNKLGKSGANYLWYLIPLLFIILGIVAFKYIGNIKKLFSLKSKIKSK